jgi:hypothetical protein
MLLANVVICKRQTSEDEGNPSGITSSVREWRKWGKSKK